MLSLRQLNLKRRRYCKIKKANNGKAILGSRTKHALHCILFLTLLIVFEVVNDGFRIWEQPYREIDPVEKYGLFSSIFLYLLRCITLLALPQSVFNCLGLLCFNAFPEKVKLKGSPMLCPFICFRIVTRGDYPNLVQNNVKRNINICKTAGLGNFMMEVVTDKVLNLQEDRRIREIVVPSTYSTKSGARFKARALQYCLEKNINILNDYDWIVHLDEETIVTVNSVKGIMNFVCDGKHHFGQGLITYANENVVNWLTTLADSFRVADDMGKLRFQFRIFHRPLFSWKGSYVVTQVYAERKVSFDHGLDGSIAEDCYFSMIADKKGYSFNFIDGEMWEKSPFTLSDFVQQRKRWLQGIYLVVHSAAIPLKNKIFLAFALYSWATVPLSTSNILLTILCPIPCWQILDFLCAFIGAMSIYMYIFGTIKSMTSYNFGLTKCILCFVGTLLAIPFNVFVENAAVIWGVLGNKHSFYVVNKDKDIRPSMTV